MLGGRSPLWLVVASCMAQFLLPVARAEDDLADVVERCERAVVKIEVEGAAGASLGSGFVVDDAGTLITNVHVLAGAQRAFATFPNGSKAEIRGTLLVDPSRDICVAKIDGAGLSFLKVASELPRKGERVTALGSPQGLSFSATTGIVSAIRPAEQLGPDIGRPTIKGTWIQVDAALSSGNSGGPLINNRGEVVGMSTLASQGGAQNLNFGISGADIQKAYEASRSQQLVTVSLGVGKLQLEDKTKRKASARPPVPAEKVEAYVKEGQAAFKDLMRDMRQELSRNTAALKEMRKGNTYLPPNSPATVDAARVLNTKTKRSTYYFRTQTVKDREVSRLQARVRELEGVEKSTSDSSSKDSLYALLSKYGPRLDTRRAGSIGFVFDAEVVAPIDDHGVVIRYEDKPYLLFVESTAGLAGGTDLTPVPVFVAGTQTIAPPGARTPIVVTVLQEVIDSELRTAIYGQTASVAGQWRTWKDKSGKFQVEAMLVESSDSNVVLKRKDGTTVTVPLDRLSDSDRELLKK